MPFPSFYRSGPAAGTQDEQQRLLWQENGQSPGYSATDGASSERSFASGSGQSPRRGWFTRPGHNAASSSQGARYDPLPPRYTPVPTEGYNPSPPFVGSTRTPSAQTGQTQRFRKFRIETERGWRYLALFTFVLGSLVAWFVQDIWAMSVLNPSAIESRRRGWDRDYTKHLAQVSSMQDITVKWAQEIQQHATAREAMRKERAEWDQERAQWRSDRREHERLQEEQMKLELEQKRRELEKEKDEEEKKKVGLRWQDPQPDQHCLRFGARRYTAKLDHIPAGYNRVKACRETQALVNGRWVAPTECDDGGPLGGLHGAWIVDWEEGPCHSYFQDFKDKGCTAEGSGKRRIESQIQNIRSGDDALKMCASTPADFHSLHFDAPHSCVNWVRGIYGIYGLWFIDDASCV